MSADSSRLVQQRAGVEQPLFLGLRHATLASAFIFRIDPHPTRVERRRLEKIPGHRPVAEMTQPRQVAVPRRDSPVRVPPLEVLDRVRPFERGGRQLTEVSGEDVGSHSRNHWCAEGSNPNSSVKSVMGVGILPSHDTRNRCNTKSQRCSTDIHGNSINSKPRAPYQSLARRCTRTDSANRWSRSLSVV